MSVYRIGNMTPVIHASAYISDESVVIGDVEIEEDVSIWPGVVVRADNEKIIIRRGSNIQDGVVLHADPGFPLVIGEGVSVGHQAMLHGCKVGARSLIGIQAILLNGSEVGERSLVGAGSLIGEKKNFPEGTLLMGVPAKVVRALSAEAVEAIERNAVQYVEKGRRFASDLVRIR